MLEQLRQVLRYDPDTGLFYWLIATRSRGGRTFSGKVAGTLKRSTGYYVLRYAGKQYRINRLAWAFMTGAWPDEFMMVEHRDANKTNNRWSNLFLVPRSKNNQNLRDKLRKNNKTGCRGVHWHPCGKWHAVISVNKRNINLGYHAKLTDAIAARQAAEYKYLDPDRRG